ncbi:hypothetical protein ACLEIY_15010 [Acetobacter tropicalis]|uniref:Uncharacterized protein n=1 Tax=Acetobacter tropicalis TaxID=104102 RepID=A0A511FRG3_9PROT|nr:hypothetical protein [Acetobacter tropicalis]KXV50949.1 hypothetical protein AD944_03515 [Acetobacter tropicalis]GAL98910.1 hypothetical protein ATR1_441d0010 [Acetobacter tropicalis]GBR68862.1 hypothetical protein AA0312_1116 [Acetobacter tropicalis NRIC 0312]GEL51536.1 hypothetical protein ATR01nite_26110 [Acetobacter tropicalis]
MSQSAPDAPAPQLISDLTFASHVLGISEQMVQDLDSCIYTKELFRTCVVEQLGGKLPSSLTVAQRYILAQQAEELFELVLRIGCVVQARAILALVNGDMVRHLAQLTTPHLMQDAAWKPVFSVAAGMPQASPEALAKAIQESGCGVLHAWCEAQPPSVALRVRSFLPEPPPAATFAYAQENAVHVVDAFVAERLCDN